MHHHQQTADLGDLQPRISNRTETVLGYLLAAAIGTSLAVLLVMELSK